MAQEAAVTGTSHGLFLERLDTANEKYDKK